MRYKIIILLVICLVFYPDVKSQEKSADDAWYILPEYQLERITPADIFLGIYELDDSVDIECPLYKINENTVAGKNIKTFISAVDSIADKSHILWTATIQQAGKYTCTDLKLTSFCPKLDFKRYKHFLKGIAIVKDHRETEIPIIILSMLSYEGTPFDQYFLPMEGRALIKSLPTPQHHIRLNYESEFFFRSVDDIYVKDSHIVTDLYYKDHYIVENCTFLLQDSAQCCKEGGSIEDILGKIK